MDAHDAACAAAKGIALYVVTPVITPAVTPVAGRSTSNDVRAGLAPSTAEVTVVPGPVTPNR